MYLVRALGGVWFAEHMSRAALAVLGGVGARDDTLFEPGGVVLIEALRFARLSSHAIVFGGAAVATLLAFAGLLPLAMLILALGRGRAMRVGELADASIEQLATLVWLEIVAWIAYGLVLAVAVMMAATAVSLTGASGKTEDACLLAFAVGCALFVIGIGIVHDLARVASVHDRAGVYASLVTALRVFRRRAVPVSFAWLWRGLMQIAALAGAWMIASSVGVKSIAALAISAAAHQVGVLVAVGWRASFFEALVGGWVSDQPPP
jgi:hypothetical protein